VCMQGDALSDGTVHHTYSTTNRGLEALMAYYGFGPAVGHRLPSR
jgi:hypothetical protein